ncbi:L-rhamnose/proton symporter RhaT [Asticcacaulis sp. SL142]|uniref:L-rhamnose/proton symporter RhaT n=1 Tax=Asticcacaulis sp. SL142 TaxID=2995155 RepID=UPI00226CC524|nr:L-rhamnose/proton symporter RhaT [Asticcacaulis sp. SL142]WAC47647.1 L-rhamnose/proton symporter RhaT [Asticcacaulis sp. SL142]
MPNPILGVLFHWIGGFASASFYVPYRRVRGWSWEIYWLIGGLFSWVFAPWIFASLQTKDLLGVLSAAPADIWGLCVMFGLLWGMGGLTYGLTMRYLGLGLGTAIALSLCAFFGTLMPPIVDGSFFTEILPTTHGQIVLFGLFLCLAGICVIGMGGASKNNDLTEEKRREVLKEFDLKKGIWVAVFCGLMSSCFAYGLASGAPVQKLSAAAGTDPLFVGLPVLCMVLLGGALTNIVWCGYLILKNKTAGEVTQTHVREDGTRPKIGLNYLLCALAGTTWYFQFFFYTMGESQMGSYGFSSWTLHMASIIIFSSLWGFALKEWKGSSRKTLTYVFAGLLLLIASTVVIGYGNYIGGAGGGH